MKLRHPAAIRVVSTIASCVVKAWLTTTRVRTVSADGLAHPIDPRAGRHMYLFWHEGLLAVCARRAPVQVLISHHADGELIAQVAQNLGFGVIRGSSSVGGERAMFEMIRGADPNSHLAVTPDGPRGPRRTMKMGPVLVASQARLSIVPVGVGFTNAWRAKSWDRFCVPKPFSTLVGVFGTPIAVSGDLDRQGIIACSQTIQVGMDSATSLAENWAAALAQDSAAPAPEWNSPAAVRQAA